MSVRDNVLKGIALLDHKFPRWVDKINLDIFNIKHCRRCVLGQLYKEYCLGIAALRISGEGGTPYGFNSNYDDIKGIGLEYFLYQADLIDRELNSIWREEILKRRTL